jgi:FlaA1/EpsC-like NDP-sugar epimerase
VERWRQNLETMKRSRKKVVVWGAGSKGVTFLNTFGSENPTQYVVDINPHKQGKFVPGTGQEVVPVEFLRAYQPDAVLVMNPNYRGEIEKSIAELGLHTELMAV